MELKRIADVNATGNVNYPSLLSNESEEGDFPP